MTNKATRTLLGASLLGASLLTLSACVRSGPFDGDFRQYRSGVFNTSGAVRGAATARPVPDARGIISYPGYQVAVARQGDTATSIAARIGLPAAEIASYNALDANTPLRAGEVLALPRRVAEGAAPLAGAPGAVDVSAVAGGAIDRATGGTSLPPATGGKAGAISATPIAAPKPIAAPTGAEPLRHRVQRGESAYSIARLYNVNVKALADWNGLGKDLAVREGQTLLIPVGAATGVTATDDTSLPGEGSATPTPPSAKEPLPKEEPVVAADPVKKPPAPDLGTTARTKLAMPVQGSIIRGYQKKKNDGIDIAAKAGTSVGAASDGTVAAITKDTSGVPILVIRHADNLLTVYANLDAIAVKKGDKVKRGQAIARVRASDPAFLHFEVRQGFDSVDPMPYLQ